MLSYVKIGAFGDVDYTRGINYTESGNKIHQSKQCKVCNFYFSRKINFQYEDSVYNSCYHCSQYEKINPNMLFRIVDTKKGTFRTVCEYFFVEIERLLNTRELNDRFGWLYKD